MTTNLSWGTHIKHICDKVNKVLGLVKRFCSNDIQDHQTETASLLVAGETAFGIRLQPVVAIYTKTTFTLEKIFPDS